MDKGINASDLREREELREEIQDLYYDIFEAQLDELEQFSDDELKDMLVDLNMKEPIVNNIKSLVGRDDDLDYTNLNDLTIEGLLELQERLEDDLKYESL